MRSEASSGSMFAYSKTSASLPSMTRVISRSVSPIAT